MHLKRGIYRTAPDNAGAEHETQVFGRLRPEGACFERKQMQTRAKTRPIDCRVITRG